MKPEYLEFCGVNSFSEPAVIDFTSLLEFGLFGIFGDTGSGKSTILDCIGFALYGNVARSRSGSIADIINDRSDKAYVRFEFAITFQGKRRQYRVERELKRKNAVQTVKVYERTEEGLLARAEGVRESNTLLERIVGLEQRDFEKCIALPQGEFAQFVKAQRSERLKLVSRLFDLEAYGERLVRRANARCAALGEEKRVISARLEPYAEISEEGNRALEEEIARLTETERIAREGLAQARAEETRISGLCLKREELSRILKKIAALEAQKEEIADLERELGRIAYASAVCAAEAERKEAKRSLSLAEEEQKEAEKRLHAAEESAAAALSYDAEGADAEIARLTGLAARAEQAERERQRAGELEARLKKCRMEYAEEAERFRGFSYEEERGRCEARLGELGEGDFLHYAETHGKAELLRKEYEIFAGELEGIAAKYPETEEDVAPLAGKYRALSEGGKTDIAALRAAYEAREAEKRECRAKLLDLEKRHGAYRAHLERLSALQTEGKSYREQLESLKTAEETLPRAELQRALESKKRERREALEAKERAGAETGRAGAACAAAAERSRAAKERLLRAEEGLASALKRGGFGFPEEAEALERRFGGASGAEARVKNFREEYAAALSRKDTLGAEDLSAGTEEHLAAAREKCRALGEEAEGALKSLALKRAELDRCVSALAKKRALEEEFSGAAKKAETAERLKKLLEGNRFMEFAAEEYLQSVAENGSTRLLTLTSGRYFLKYDGGFYVGDNLNGGALRGVYTLSGGETFLVSLSLALALSSEICQKSLRPIEFFFLDEGFGTLDERLVDVVMDSLEKLKGEHFSIGIISHVEELKHRIERKLLVEKATEKHGSRIHV